MISVVVAALGKFGFEVASFAAILASAGFAIGMAFQGTLGNFAAGIMLLVFRPFKVGDVISAAGVTCAHGSSVRYVWGQFLALNRIFIERCPLSHD